MQDPNRQRREQPSRPAPGNPPHNPTQYVNTVSNPSRPIPPATRQKWVPYAILGGGVAFTVLCSLIAFLMIGIAILNQDQIAAGVQVAGVEIGGLSADDARAELSAKLSTMPPITARDNAPDGVREWQTSYTQLGVSYDLDAMLTEAQEANRGAKLAPRYVVDLSKTMQGFIDLAALVEIPAAPGSPPQEGRSLDIEGMVERIRVNPGGELSDSTLDLDIVVTPAPALTSENADQFIGETTEYIVQGGDELGLIAKRFNVDLIDILSLNDITNPDLLYVGETLLIPAPGEYAPSEGDAPPAPTQSGKSILVDTSAQRIYAYENGELVRSHLVSTGTSETPTVKGDYNIYLKFVADDMSGPGYYLADVPYAMYFYQGYAIHGTYWHNKFGRPMSHGCVNLPTEEAEWFFNFAEMGTLVRVI